MQLDALKKAGCKKIYQEIVSGANKEFIKAVGKLEENLLILLDLNKVMGLQEATNIEEMAS